MRLARCRLARRQSPLPDENPLSRHVQQTSFHYRYSKLNSLPVSAPIKIPAHHGPPRTTTTWTKPSPWHDRPRHIDLARHDSTTATLTFPTHRSSPSRYDPRGTPDLFLQSVFSRSLLEIFHSEICLSRSPTSSVRDRLRIYRSHFRPPASLLASDSSSRLTSPPVGVALGDPFTRHAPRPFGSRLADGRRL